MLKSNTPFMTKVTFSL